MSAGPIAGRTSHPHYEILEQCGQGGMGIVYKARDRRLNRIVALKFLIAGRTDADRALARFRREAESIAALNHPNIAVLYETGVWGEEPFLAMEYLPGGSLAHRRRPGGAHYEELIRYAAELGAGLQFAHSHGILHRDIKPGNGMFSEHGALKLVDFGLAKTADDEDITRTGASVGTIGYMAPELLRGQDATAGSDIYALGATLYELAAGRSMFSAKNLGSLVDQILKSPPVALSSLRPDLPASFTDAIARATAPDPKERFSSVNQFLDGVGLPATRTLTVEISGSRSIRRLRPLRMAGVIAGLLALAAGVYFTRRAAAPANRILVVLPFDNLGGDPANQPLCDGLQETVTGLLSMAAPRNLFVIPSSEVRRSQVRTIAEARKQFRADLALTGAAQKSADRLQLTLNLDDAALLRQKDSRIISVSSSETASLQTRLADDLGSLFGYAPLARSGALPGETTANSTAYSLYLQGTGALENRQGQPAIEYLRNALEADPGFAPARAKLAEAYLWENTFTSDPKWLALADAEVVRASQSGSGHEVLMAQAMIRKATGDPELAIRSFNLLLKSEPANMEARQLLAQALISAKRPDEAEKTLRQAIALRPGYWPLHNTLGIFYMNRHDYGRAEQALSSAVALAPDVAVVYSNLGALYFTMDRLKDAAANFEHSLAIAPNALAHANLCAVRFYQGNYAEAAKHARAATALQPTNPANWGNLGDALWQIPGEKAGALEAFQSAALLASEQLAINANNVRLRRSYALFLAKLGRTRESIEQIRLALSQAPDDMNVQFYAARIYAVTGETSLAIAALDKCKALGYSPNEIEREPDLAAIRNRSNAR